MIQKKSCIFLSLHFCVFIHLNWLLSRLFCWCYCCYCWKFIIQCLKKNIFRRQIIFAVYAIFAHQFRFRLIFILCLIYRAFVIIFRRLLFCIYICHTQKAATTSSHQCVRDLNVQITAIRPF